MTGCSNQHGEGLQARVGILAGLLIVGAVLGGCAGSPDFLVRTEFVPYTQDQLADLEVKATHSYRIQERDKLKVYFAYERELNQDGVVVLNDGTISLIGVGNIRVAGLTMAEADSVLTVAYSKEYREPALSVIMQETRGRQVYVLGEVKQPGLYNVPMGGIDVLSAVTVAGGFSSDAAKGGVLVIRVTADGYRFQEVNLDRSDELSFAGVATVALQSYDLVWVPRSRVGDFGYFARNVLTGLANFTRIVYDVNFISSGGFGRF